ncbi:hypothetical protein [Bacillus chungangensis]|uniref:Nucleotidyltransferase n=1 Tax=Bacillus chungangensis TaxID=587633 RepID=A0ABT9WSC0_9BACI|nr:hypothetical protein [Bacillus chungangensis]MDQ0176014.1 putative nucleotidyltransferase [Bacillus chungangensis]
MNDQERLEEIKELLCEIKEKIEEGKREDVETINEKIIDLYLNNHIDWLTSTVEQLIDREQDLKNRLKEKGDKLAKVKSWLKTERRKRKKAEWQAMIHERAHGDVYTKLFELQESLKGELK